MRYFHKINLYFRSNFEKVQKTQYFSKIKALDFNQNLIENVQGLKILIEFEVKVCRTSKVSKLQIQILKLHFLCLFKILMKYKITIC